MKLVSIELLLTDDQAKVLDEDGPTEWLALIHRRILDDMQPRVASVEDVVGRHGVESWDDWAPDRKRTTWFDTAEARDRAASAELAENRCVRHVARVATRVRSDGPGGDVGYPPG